MATRRGLRLRLRHEHLGEEVVDDPIVFEPDEAELEEITAEIADIAQTIERSDFAGVGDPLVCGRCPYQHACPDAAGEVHSDLPVLVSSDPTVDPF